MKPRTTCRPGSGTRAVVGLALLLQVAAHAPLRAQGTAADYLRADSFAARSSGLVVGVAEDPGWVEETHHFWYRTSVEGGHRFFLVDADAATKAPAFDHERLARALTAARGDTVRALDLPFRRFDYVDHESAIEFVLADSTWRCGLADYACTNRGAERRRGGGLPYPWEAGPGQLWRLQDGDPVASPDGQREAFVVNHNVAVRAVGSKDYTLLSQDGSEGNMYTRASIVWSPDSKRLAVYRVVPGFQREIHYVRSSPEDQLQPEFSSLIYAKPGDVLDRETPVIFDVAAGSPRGRG